jgi:GNAT superfamily N-acetyltransferase
MVPQMTKHDLTIERAIEVFVHGFTFTRSFTHPYLADRITPGVWALRDAPRRSGDYRSDEYVAYGVAPAEVDGLARKHSRGHYKVCMIRAVGEADTELRTGFKAMGYRLMATEAFMVHDLARIAAVPEPFPVVRVRTVEQADMLARAARTRQILHEHLAASPAPMRQYMALDGEEPVGWVGCVAAGGSGWCTNMMVKPAYRRRGIARALMTWMLTDDRAEGVQANVLLASHAGSRLYPTVGYQTIGELLLFVPPRGGGHL